MNYAHLKFPPYEWFKALPLKREVERFDHGTKKYFKTTEHCEYTLPLFRTPTSVYGRFSYNEDDSRFIYFDVMEDGYCDHNERLNMRLKFNKTNYEKICKHAQEVYEEFQRDLLSDLSYLWENRDPKEWAENNAE